jgi:glycosyltransferase involved in cell wall biosynthesis
MLAPLIEPVPPTGYGGTERVIAVLTDELVRRGHDVTLFASGDSVTSATLVAGAPRALRVDGSDDYVGPTLLHIGDLYARAGEFEVIHNHADYLAFPFARLTPTPTITTAHFRLDIPHTQALYRRFPQHPLVSISDSQRRPLPNANWLATIPNAIGLEHFHFRPGRGTYLAFLGRMSPEKRPDRAIEVARELGMPLIMAGKVDPYWDGTYFEQFIEPMITASPLIEFIGEVDEQEKDQLLGGAYAYLFPIDWPEPFGLTLIEAMATGTPVIAMNAGAVSEIVLDGQTGFICTGLRDMFDAVARVPSIDRAACRAHVESHFSADVMATRYERLFTRIAGGREVSSTPAIPPLPLDPLGDVATPA